MFYFEINAVHFRGSINTLSGTIYHLSEFGHLGLVGHSVPLSQSVSRGVSSLRDRQIRNAVASILAVRY